MPIPEAPSVKHQAVYCTHCKNLIGFFIEVGNQVWLQAGGIQIRVTHAQCCRCHTEYHFVASEKPLTDLHYPIATENPPCYNDPVKQ